MAPWLLKTLAATVAVPRTGSPFAVGISSASRRLPMSARVTASVGAFWNTVLVRGRVNVIAYLVRFAAILLMELWTPPVSANAGVGMGAFGMLAVVRVSRSDARSMVR